MYKSSQDSFKERELKHVATEFNKAKFKTLEHIKAHLAVCKFVSHPYEVDDEDLHQESEKVFGIQHHKVCCGYGEELRVNVCSSDHQMVYVVVQRDLDSKQKGVYYKWIKKMQ